MKILSLMAAISFAAMAQEAPKVVPDRDEVRIAIIDTGFDVNHDGGVLLSHKPVICDDGKDTFNFVDLNKDGNPTTDVKDKHGHGTHIAGLISMKAGEAKVCLIILKYYDSEATGEQNLERSNRSIRKAIDLGADIINYSGGGVLRNEPECTLIKEALDKDIVFVAAAGNEKSDLSKPYNKFYPLMCDKRVVGVVALEKSGKRPIIMSNISTDKDQVNLDEEVGQDVLSTLPGGQFGYMTGTSQAAAIMSGKLANHLYILRKSVYGRHLIKKGPGWAR